MFRIAAALLLALLPGAAAATTPEARTAASFDRLAGDAAAQRLFLQAMPKGGDLHNHLGGSTCAEDDWRLEQAFAGFEAGSDALAAALGR